MRDSPRQSRAAMLAGLPLVLMGGLYVYAGRSAATAPAATHASTPSQCGEATDLRTAWYVAQDHVRRRLGNRQQASFDSLEAGMDDPADRVRAIAGGGYLVEGWVQTGGGARQQFSCELTRNGDGGWICDRLEIVQAY